MRRKLGRTAIALVLAACGRSAPPPAAPPEAIPVTLALSVPAAGVGGIATTGTVRLKRETGLAFNTGGRIAAVDVREGEIVRSGQPLARLDPTGLDAAAAAARADAVRARADYARLAKLGGEGWVTRGRVESAQAAAAAATARVDQTGFDVRFGRIVAPVGGVVLRRAFEPGQMVSAGTPVVTIGELGSGYVLRVPLSDADLPRVRLGQGAAVTIGGSAPLAATVSEIAGRGDERTGTFQVELRLPGSAGLRSGLIGNAVIRTGGGNDAGGVAVPAGAVFAVRADEGFVYVHDAAKGTVRSRMVGVGALSGRDVVVTGLAVGTPVVVSGVDRLRDGIAVKVIR